MTSFPSPWRLVALLVLTLLPSACIERTSCGPRAAAVDPEIVAGGPDEGEPEPALPALRPCRADDPSGCSVGRSDEAAGVVHGGRYPVEVWPTDPVLGAADARITIVVFSDFECPYCRRLEPVLSELREQYEDDLRIVWKDHPLSMHAFALPAALLARGAQAKGGNALFWQVHDRLFEDQDQLDGVWLQALARDLDLPWPPLSSELVDRSLEHARALGVRSTPTSFVNGRAVVGTRPLETFTSLIDEELALMNRRAR